MRTILLAAVAAVAALGSASRLTAADDPFAFKDGDRVVFLGSTLIEREQKYGWWELLLTLKNRDKAVLFRNLGWSGDTVFGEARNGFDNSPKGFERLVSLTTELKPTVIVICYGQNESFDGKAGVPAFTAGLERLLDALAPTKARVVLMSPTPFEKGAGLADPDKRNADLSLYRDAIKDMAGKQGVAFVDLFERFRPALDGLHEKTRYTDNGVHLTGTGYMLGDYYLIGSPEGRGTQVLFGRGIMNDIEPLRAKIIEKNRLFFYRWRPQNETYLFGFRKHEQGKNGAEVAAFDPLVAAAETEIAELKGQVVGGTKP